MNFMNSMTSLISRPQLGHVFYVAETSNAANFAPVESLWLHDVVSNTKITFAKEGMNDYMSRYACTLIATVQRRRWRKYQFVVLSVLSSMLLPF